MSFRRKLLLISHSLLVAVISISNSSFFNLQKVSCWMTKRGKGLILYLEHSCWWLAYKTISIKIPFSALSATRDNMSCYINKAPATARRPSLASRCCGNCKYNDFAFWSGYVLEFKVKLTFFYSVIQEETFYWFSVVN